MFYRTFNGNYIELPLEQKKEHSFLNIDAAVNRFTHFFNSSKHANMRPNR